MHQRDRRTDRGTDGQMDTGRQQRPFLRIASRGKNGASSISIYACGNVALLLVCVDFIIYKWQFRQTSWVTCSPEICLYSPYRDASCVNDRCSCGSKCARSWVGTGSPITRSNFGWNRSDLARVSLSDLNLRSFDDRVGSSHQVRKLLIRSQLCPAGFRTGEVRNCVQHGVLTIRVLTGGVH